MPAHLIKRKDCGDTYYLVDGELTRSLKTKVKRHAEALLQQYINGKYNLNAVPTVGAYYKVWIERKIEPLYRRSKIRDYQQAFKKHILPQFGDTSLLEIKHGVLADFQILLLKTISSNSQKGLKVKTVRNIIDSSFRAMYRDARAEYEPLAGKDPFLDLRWPKDGAKRGLNGSSLELSKSTGAATAHKINCVHNCNADYLIPNLASGQRRVKSAFCF